MKRANGMGSVYKLSGKRRKPYAAAVTINGKRVVLATFSKPKLAIEYLSNYICNPYDIDYSKYTTLQLFEEWFPTYNKSNSSKNNYKNAFYQHSKAVHNKTFIELRKKDIQYLIDNSNLKYTGRSYIKIVFSALFEYAKEKDLGVKENYARGVKLGDKSISVMHKSFTNKDFETVCNNSDKEFVDIIMVYLYIGARPGELLKITKDKVFLEENYMVGGIKTKAGTDRIMPIHPKIKEIIEKHYHKNSVYLFENKKGKQITYKTFGKKFKEVLSSLNLEEEYKPHDTRHTFSTRAKLSGMDDLCRKLIMGHAINDLTDNIYTHIPKEKLIEEVKKLK